MNANETKVEDFLSSNKKDIREPKLPPMLLPDFGVRLRRELSRTLSRTIDKSGRGSDLSIFHRADGGYCFNSPQLGLRDVRQ